MKRISKILIVFAIIFLLTLTEVLLINGMSKSEDLVDVIVVTKNVDAFSELNSDNTKVIKYPKKFVPNNVAYSLNDVIGKVVLTNLNAQEMIFKRKLIDKSESTFAVEGKRFIAIKPEAEDVAAWQIRRGDTVDVLCANNLDSMQVGQRQVFKDIKVIGIIDENYDVINADKLSQSELNVKPKLIVLEVTLEQAVQIYKFKKKGVLTILSKQMIGGYHE